jgi:ribonuclease Z
MLEEDFKIQILKERLVDYNLEPGPWLTKFKQDIYAGLKDDTDYLITFKKSGKIIEKTFLFGDLKNAITKISPGKTIAYITDIIGSHENLEKILTTFSNCDMLFIEAGFLSSDVEQAKKTYHLTAQEAGKIAAMLNCKYLKVFHHSFRYKGMESELQKEAREAFLSHLPRPLS